MRPRVRGTVLSSEFKSTDTKFTNNNGMPRWQNKEKNDVNQNQQMRTQKNRMDPVTVEHHLLENEVDFELLWRCITKIWRTIQMATYTKEIENLNNKIVYKNSTVQLPMFILVSMLFGYAIGGLPGPPWWAF